MSLNSQTLDYKAMIDLCENEIMLIKFFGIYKESMISVRILRLRNDMKGKTMHLPQ